MARHTRTVKKNRQGNKSFLDKVVDAAKIDMSDVGQVTAARNLYLKNKEEDIKKAVAAGYSYTTIAKAATEELLEMDIPKSFVAMIDGEEITLETKIGPEVIKKISEL